MDYPFEKGWRDYYVALEESLSSLDYCILFPKYASKMNKGQGSDNIIISELLAAGHDAQLGFDLFISTVALCERFGHQLFEYGSGNKCIALFLAAGAVPNIGPIFVEKFHESLSGIMLEDEIKGYKIRGVLLDAIVAQTRVDVSSYYNWKIIEGKKWEDIIDDPDLYDLPYETQRMMALKYTSKFLQTFV